jgi:hypothetical protein
VEGVKGYRYRYVTWQEVADQRLARERLLELALDSLSADEATSARCMSAFLRYHTHCSREVCALAEREGEQLGARMGVIRTAHLAVQDYRAAL